MGASRLWHPGHIMALAFSFDDKTVASLAADRSIRLWSAADGRQKGAFPAPGGIGGVPQFSVLAFSPDDKLLAASDLEDGLRVFDLARGKLRFHLASQRGKKIHGAAFARDGKTLATAQADGVVLWDTTTGKQVRRLEGHEGAVFAVAFSANGARLLTGGQDGTVRLWEATTGKQLQELVGHRQAVRAVALSADGKLAASSGADDSVRTWDLKGEQVRRFSPEAWGLRFTPDGSALAAGGVRQSPYALHLWDLKSGKDRCPKDDRLPRPRTVGLSSRGTIAAVAESNHIQLLEIASGKDLCPVAGHRGRIDVVAYSPDGRLLATGGADRVIRLWGWASGKELRVLKGHIGPISALAFTPDGKTLASASQHDKIVSLWDVDSGKERRRLGSDESLRVPGLHFSPDGRLLVRRNARNGLNVWETATGKRARELAAGNAARLASADAVGFGADGKSLLAVSGSDGTLYAWDVKGWKRTARPLPRALGVGEQEGGPRDPLLLFSPDGRSLVHCDRDRKGHLVLSLWDVATLTRARPFGKVGTKPLLSPQWPDSVFVCFSPDGRMLAAAGANEVVVWEVATGLERVRLRRPGLAAVMAFAPDGRRLACGGPDGAALVYDLASADGKGPAAKTKLTAAKLGALWDELRSDDAARAFRALCVLRSAGAAMVPYLARQLRPTIAVPGKRLDNLIADLDADDFAVRSTATSELEKLGELAGPALKKLVAGKPSVEARQRAEALLGKLEQRRALALTPDRLREVRTIEVLEGIAGGEARKALAALAEGAPGALRTEEAKAALQRLGRRPGAKP
jgi:WD40 repeat protein